METDATLHLKDFGVRASLMDDGERNGVRKTFVGTHCWMAPLVMEMSKGYNSKADILYNKPSKHLNIKGTVHH